MYSHSYIYGSLQLTYSVASIYLYKKSKINSHANWQIHLYVYSLAFLICFGTYLKPLGHGLFLWVFTLPIIYYLLLGKKSGFSVTLATILIQAIIVYLKTGDELYFKIFPIMVNLMFCYICIWTVSHVYESNREIAEKALHKLALKDALTGANNRLAFKNTFNSISRQKSSTALFLLILDVDFFKQVNDKFGHEAGDDILIQISDLFFKLVGAENVFRFGGEEFCIFLHEVSKEAAMVQADLIRQTVEEAILKSQGKRIPITVSVGVSEYQPGMELSALLRKADDGLYFAKDNGRNRVVHSKMAEVDLVDNLRSI